MAKKSTRNPQPDNRRPRPVVETQTGASMPERPVVPARATTPIPAPISRVAAHETVSPATAMPFSRQNYRLMLIGIAVILIGFFIMTLDNEPFGFGFLGLTLGPLVVMAGFLFEFYAILAKPKRALTDQPV